MAFFDFLNSPEGRQAAAGALMDIGNIWTRSGPGGGAPHGLVPGGNLQRAFMRNAENARHAQRVQAQQALTQGRQKWGMSPTFVKDRKTGEYLPVQFSNYGGAQIPGVGPVDPEKHEFVRPYSYQDLGYGVGAYPYGAGQPEGVTPKGPPPETRPEYKGEQTEATKRAETTVKREAAMPKARRKLIAFENQADLVLKTIHEAKQKVGPFTAGWGAYLRTLPETDARKLKGLIDTVIANVGFNSLQEMRDFSPTGGALGQVAIQELAMLQATRGKLDQLQSDDDLKQVLTQVEDVIRKMAQDTRTAFSSDYAEASLPKIPALIVTPPVAAPGAAPARKEIFWGDMK